MLDQLKDKLDFNRKDLILVGNGEGDDFTIDTSVGEYRFIHTDSIREIFHEECSQTIEDCYDLENVPSFVVIDWKATTDNCLIDGYGHHFAVYDGMEYEIADTNGVIQWYVFRTN